MSQEVEQAAAQAEAQVIPEHSLMELFEELSFQEKIRRVMEGLKQPPDSGEYKWARLQLLRLWAPVAGVTAPVIAIFLVALLAILSPQQQRVMEVQIMEPEKQEELKEIEEIKEEVPPPEVVEYQIPDPSLPESLVPSPPVDFSPKPAAFDSVAIIKSPVIFKGIYGSRSPGARGAATRQYGGSGTEGAVLRALRWLKKNQNQDGSWPSTKPAMTGMALLCFLAHGETPASEEFGQTVEYAIRWLCDNYQGDKWNGADGHEYSHPIAAYALCEAYGLTKVPSIREVARKAILRIMNGQHASGGFNYNLNQADRDDTSVMGWCAQALKAAKMAEVLDTEEMEKLDACMKKAIEGFKKNYQEGNSGYGSFGYTSPGNTGLTGVGTLCMQLLGAANSPQVQNALANMEDCTFNWGGGGKYNQNYYWYYITQAKFHAGGGTWNSWNKLFSPTLCKNQTVIKDGIQGPDGKMKDIGYWEMERALSGHTDGGEGARVMNTCLACLQLEVYYRYLPTFKPPEIEKEAPAAAKDANVQIAIRGI